MKTPPMRPPVKPTGPTQGLSKPTTISEGFGVTPTEMPVTPAVTGTATTAAPSGVSAG
jgi:hypothetical protein